MRGRALTLAALTIIATTADARVIRCVDANGKLYFSDVSCPDDATSAQVIDASQHAWRRPAENPNSVVNQVNALNRERVAKQRVESARAAREQAVLNAAIDHFRASASRDEAAQANAKIAARQERSMREMDAQMQMMEARQNIQRQQLEIKMQQMQMYER